LREYAARSTGQELQQESAGDCRRRIRASRMVQEIAGVALQPAGGCRSGRSSIRGCRRLQEGAGVVGVTVVGRPMFDRLERCAGCGERTLCWRVTLPCYYLPCLAPSQPIQRDGNSDTVEAALIQHTAYSCDNYISTLFSLLSCNTVVNLKLNLNVLFLRSNEPCAVKVGPLPVIKKNVINTRLIKH
jgi:hypothetical protein